MATTSLQQTINTTYNQETTTSLTKRFMNWCRTQEHNRLLWLGVALAAHGCILTPLTVLTVLLAGANIYLFVLALVAMGISLVTNLAAMPTRVTIPVFIFSILIDLAIVFSCVAIGFDITQAFS